MLRFVQHLQHLSEVTVFWGVTGYEHKHDIRIWKNTRHSDLLGILRNIHELKGVIVNGDLYLASAFEATHYDIEEALHKLAIGGGGNSADIGVYFADTKNVNGEEGWRVHMKEVNGVWVAVQGDFPGGATPQSREDISHPRIKKALGVK